MPKYYVHYSMLGSGVLEIEAENEEEADDLAFDKTTEELIEGCDFKRGLSVDHIEEAYNDE